MEYGKMFQEIGELLTLTKTNMPDEYDNNLQERQEEARENEDRNYKTNNE